MNKVTYIGGIVLASLVLAPIAASAHDVFSYRYDYAKQSDSPDRESSKEKSVEPSFVSHDLTPSVRRADAASDTKEVSSESLKPSALTGSSGKRVVFANPRK